MKLVVSKKYLTIKQLKFVIVFESSVRSRELCLVGCR